MLTFLNRRISKENKEHKDGNDPHTPRHASDASSSTPTDAETSPCSPTPSLTQSFSQPRPTPSPSYARARRTGVQLAALLSEPFATLPLQASRDDGAMPLPVLCYNACLIELRDMFRVLSAVRGALSGSGGDKAVLAAVQERVDVFYQWFEGFFEIVTAIFDAEEDILFPYISEAGRGAPLPNALCAKRRKTKKERAKEQCWDILELKMQFDRRTSRPCELEALVRDLHEEAELLAARVIAHFSDVKDGLSDVLDTHFGPDERRLIESTYLGNLRATDAGRFVITAFGRAYADRERRAAFLEEALRSAKNGKANIVKQVRKFQKCHTDLVHKVAPLQPLQP